MSKKKQKKNLKNDMQVVSDASELSVIQPSTEVTPMVMMQLAVSQGAPIEQLERLWALNEKVEAANARKAFYAALAEFKKDPPQVVKDKKNSQYNNSAYVSIGRMVTEVSEAMGKVGLSHSWTYGENDEGEIICTCVMSHALGHQESVTLSSPLDVSGAKNPLQARKSTRTYLKLETFEAATGMASVEGNLDDDGNAAKIPVKTITKDDSNKLHARISENELNMNRFMKWLKADLGLDTIDDIPAELYQKVNNKITSTIKAKESKS